MMGKAKRRKAVKRKVKIQKTDLTATALQKAKRHAGEFMGKYDLLLRDKVKGWSGAANQYLRDKHKELFGEKPTHVPVAIAKARVCYELMALGYKEYGVEDLLPKNFDQNKKAAMDNNLNGFAPDVGELIRLSTQGENGESSAPAKEVKSPREKEPKKVKPPKTKKESVPKSKKESAQGYAAEILWGNSKTKYTDKQIQKMVLKKFPEATGYKKLSTIKNVRRRLNTGFIKKYGTPKKEIKEYK